MFNRYFVMDTFSKLENKLYKLQNVGSIKFGTTEDWSSLDDLRKAKAPKTYFFVENILDKVEDFVLFFCNLETSVRSFFYNSLIHKPHILRSPNLKLGKYYEINHRFLECCFSALVDFVESEKAWMHYITLDDEKQKLFDKENKRVWYRNIFKPTFNYPELGLSYLKWEQSLKNDKDSGYKEDNPEFNLPTRQANNASECEFLYTWWKNRSNRLEPYDMSYVINPLAEKYKTTSDIIDNSLHKKSFFGFNKNKEHIDISNEDQKFYQDELKNQSVLGSKYEDEDEEMLIRLIKLSKHSLWT